MSGDFERAIQSAIAAAIEQEVNAVIPEIEKRVRARIGGIAAKIAQHTEFSAMREALVITVRFPEDKRHGDSETLPTRPGGYGG